MPREMSDEHRKAVADREVREGTFAANEHEDNSIDVSNPGYVGVDPEYRNSAYGLESPNPESDDPIVQRAKASAERLSNLNVNPSGYTPGAHRAGRGLKVGDPGATSPRGPVTETPAPVTAPVAATDETVDGGTTEQTGDGGTGTPQ